MKDFVKTLGEREKENNGKPSEDNNPSQEKTEKIEKINNTQLIHWIL